MTTQRYEGRPLTCWLAGAVCAMLLGCTTGGSTLAPSTMAPTPPDPYVWLEEVEGERALAWVRTENQRTVDALGSSARFRELEASLRAVLDSNENIPFVQKFGAHYYNFWRDRSQPRGVWRRTTPESYRQAAPQWETVLDVDALNKAEGTSWVWKGVRCLQPMQRRCLIELSPGGSDASVVREFDLQNRQWVSGGFESPLSKGSLEWEDENTVLASLITARDDATASGYPRKVRRWKRGTPLATAPVVYEGPATDVGSWLVRDTTEGAQRSFVFRAKAFYNDEMLWLPPSGPARRIDVPDSAQKSSAGPWLVLRLRQDWSVGGRVHSAGSLLVSRIEPWLRGERAPMEVLFEPSASTSLMRVDSERRPFVQVKDHLVVPVLDDVKHVIHVHTPTPQGWKRSTMPGVPPLSRVQLSAVDKSSSNALWITRAGFLEPTTLQMAEVGEQAPLTIKSLPSLFNGSSHEVLQHFATSKDGTRVPYFLVRLKGKAADGRSPTILYGYGGFEVSMLPSYSATLGKAWLERGGTFVMANIRGGGEYGPRWHQAALRGQRGRAFEDFAAIAQDLVARGITAPKHLAVRGGSNGGLLTGNMLVQYPQLVGGVVIEVPLLDMRRYHRLLAGASWMAEYGDPDNPQDWAFLQRHSPYHRVDPAMSYPPSIILTSTKDDRVHPAHARKMAALLRQHGKPVHYYENVEGGHAGSASNAQAAFKGALTYEFLWRTLSP